MGTKGTWRRPAAVDDLELKQRWEHTFTGGPTPTHRTNDAVFVEHEIAPQPSEH